jgi:6-pyruvoyltetrahydropterin/6-carboxytetrahydropterin synthase
MKYIIDKSFSYCYGHRVHNQRLDTNFTENGDACLACRHLHGHEGLVKVFLEEDYNPDADEISNVEQTGMVTDFKHLGWFKNFIDDVLDHKFIMDIQDPLLPFEVSMLMDSHNNLDYSKLHKMVEGYYIPDLTYINNVLENSDLDANQISAIYEKYEGFILVDFVPTSENITAWLLSIAQEKMKNLPGVRVKAVEYWETPKSHCRVET